MPISQFLEHHFRHFNARETLAAAKAWREHDAAGRRMLVTLAGAMSTAEIGRSLAPLIDAGKVHAISCTAANLEEDLFHLLGQPDYELLPHYRDLTPADEADLLRRRLNRVTDTCIPESVVLKLEARILDLCRSATDAGESLFPFELFYRLIDSGWVAEHAQAPLENSWVLAAHRAGIPIYSPGFEDSTLGNIFAARVISGELPRHEVVRPGTAQMQHLVDWYRTQTADSTVGFFQIGGGIAGDFAICAVPLILQDLKLDAPLWSYFAQISDSTTSYGSYSGAVPNEKITWSKIAADTPRFMINSDASIVAPLIFAYVLGL